MTGDKDCFLSFEERDGGLITFCNNDKAKIKGMCIIGNNNFAKIKDV